MVMRMTTVVHLAPPMRLLQTHRAVCTIQNATTSSTAARVDIATQKLAVNRIEPVVSKRLATVVVASMYEAAPWTQNAVLDLSAITVIAN